MTSLVTTNSSSTPKTTSITTLSTPCFTHLNIYPISFPCLIAYDTPIPEATIPTPIIRTVIISCFFIASVFRLTSFRLIYLSALGSISWVFFLDVSEAVFTFIYFSAILNQFVCIVFIRWGTSCYVLKLWLNMVYWIRAAQQHWLHGDLTNWFWTTPCVLFLFWFSSLCFAQFRIFLRFPHSALISPQPS